MGEAGKGSEAVGRGREGRLLAAVVLAGALSALTVVLALAAPWSSFMHVATNLSQTPTRASSFADLALSPDGDRVVVVWPEAYEDRGNARGSVILRWASESTGNGWSDPVTVFLGSDEECAVRAAVAMTGTTVHVAYMTWSPCTDPTAQAIFYRTYQIGARLGTPRAITTVSPLGNDPGFTDVDIALDEAGNPHFVYAYFERGDVGDVGSVYYTWLEGTQQEAEEKVSATDHNARRPAIAWANNAIHVTWVAEVAVQYGVSYRVYYRRRASGEGGVWGEPQMLFAQGAQRLPYDPGIAAYGDTVYLVWDKGYDCREVASELQCEEFTLAYTRSDNGGISWPRTGTSDPIWCEVGGGQWEENHRYTSTNSENVWEYGQFLRPSVALDGQGKPTVAWHVNDGGQEQPDYNILYIEAESVPTDMTQCVTWSEVISLTQNAGGQSTSPVVARSTVADTDPYLAYVWSDVETAQFPGVDWETFYDGNAYESYPHVFLPVVLRGYAGGDGGGGGEG